VSEYTSPLAPVLKEYTSFRQASGRWSESYDVSLRLFDKHCKAICTDSDVLTQAMVDGWCAKRGTESNNSCRRRIYPVASLIIYMQRRGMTDVKAPVIPRQEPNAYIPHAFTPDELTNFFHACDNIPSIQTKKGKWRRMTIPVFFRLLYSSGIRTTEARLLRRSGVDLARGVLNIEYSKGHAQHFAVLNDSVLRLTQMYDLAVGALYPNRTYFFPYGEDSHLTADWVQRNFSEMWRKKNSAHAIPYEFRHNYAVENINSWTDDGFGFNDKLCYLSKSMGHSVIESTKYYYSLVPRLADVLAARTDEDEMIPGVPHEGF